MYEEDFEQIKLGVMHQLKRLHPRLTYHTPGHTLDVLAQCERIAVAEGHTNIKDLFLLRVAALYHDTGFLNRYANHEEESCRIFLTDTAGLNFTGEDKDVVQHLIMATRIPQQPITLAEKILCDADLDYLGRPDFFKIGDRLRQEFLYYGIVADDEAWRELQLRFLTAHQYHTASSQALREPVKQRHLQACLQPEK